MFKKIVAMAVFAMTLTIGTSPLWAISGGMDNYKTVEQRGHTGAPAVAGMAVDTAAGIVRR